MALQIAYFEGLTWDENALIARYEKRIAELEAELEARREMMDIGGQVVDEAEKIIDPIETSMLWLSVKTFRKFQTKFFRSF